MNISTKVLEQKQYSSVRGNKARCINYAGCPMCYGCRAYDSRDPECRECKQEDIARGKSYNICKTNLHEAWKINKLIGKNQINLDEKIEFKNGSTI